MLTLNELKNGVDRFCGTASAVVDRLVDLRRNGGRHPRRHHAPARKHPPGDIAAHDEGDVVMPGIGFNPPEGPIDVHGFSLDDLEEPALADEQGAGEVVPAIVAVRHSDDLRERQKRQVGIVGGAAVGDADHGTLQIEFERRVDPKVAATSAPLVGRRPLCDLTAMKATIDHPNEPGQWTLLEDRRPAALWRREKSDPFPVTLYYVVCPPRQTEVVYVEDQARALFARLAPHGSLEASRP